MDTTSPVTHISLCAGYGGIDLGLRRAIRGLRTIAVSEIEAYAVANLVAKMEAGLLDPAPVWTDLKSFPYGKFHGLVDILSGGYPCQPFSAAGKRLGADDPRHLWPWIRDGIDAMRPGMCFLENVEGHISLGLREVVGELEGLGYRATWGIFSAAEVGAPHQRKRVFILAHRNNEGLEGWHGRILPECAGERAAWPSRPSVPQHYWEPPRTVANAQRARRGQEAVGGVAGVRQENPDRAGECHPVDDTACRGFSRCDLSVRSGELQQATPDVAGAGAAMAHAIGPDKARREPAGGEAQDGGPHNQSGGSVTRVGRPQPRLGGRPDGAAHRLDRHGVAGANRIDRLRLDGNGVVPATAERAFRVLFNRFLT